MKEELKMAGEEYYLSNSHLFMEKYRSIFLQGGALTIIVT